MRAPLAESSADMLFMCCGYPPAPTGRRNRHAVVMDGALYPSISAAANAAGVKANAFTQALRVGRTRSRGHEIRYAEEEA